MAFLKVLEAADGVYLCEVHNVNPEAVYRIDYLCAFVASIQWIQFRLPNISRPAKYRNWKAINESVA